jgi:hypothetical protein
MADSFEIAPYPPRQLLLRGADASCNFSLGVLGSDLDGSQRNEYAGRP